MENRLSRWMKFLLFSIFLLFFLPPVNSQTALEIVKRADENQQGEYNTGVMKMTIMRPDWSREMTMKTWAKGSKYSLTMITSPARDKGIAFLKRDKEIWNWQPSIDRSIKLPPSMMMQSWMGSDFTNDDLVNQSSIVTDYEHKILGEAEIEGRFCWNIELIPKEDAPVVWGKILIWIDKQDYLQLKSEFYDEDYYLVNTMLGKQIKKMGGRIIPSVFEIIPADKEGHKTIVEQVEVDFNTTIPDDFFTVQNMKRIRS